MNANGYSVFDDNALGHGANYVAIAGLLRGPEVGLGGGPSLTFMGRLLHRAKAFLLLAVVVIGQLITCLPACLDECLRKWVFARASCDM